MWTELVLFLLLVLAYYVARDMKPKRMPPGPWEIPFLGNRMIINVKYMLGLRELYGDIVTTRLMHMRTVLIYDYHTAKEVMASNDFADRPAFFMEEFGLDDRKKGGVVTGNGAPWQHDRRFLLRNLRNLGMGKSSMEDALHTEAQAMVEDLRKYEGEIVKESPLSFRTVALNIIWQMVAGKRYDLRSKDVISIFEATNKFRTDSTPLSMSFMFAPKWMKAVIPKSIQVKLFKVDLLDKFFEEMKSIVDKHIDEAEEKFRNGFDGEDVISEYLRGMKEHENDPDSPFWKGALRQNVNDLFGAGSDTVFNMLRWTVFLMARYPELVREMRDQIDTVTSKGEMVSLARKAELPLIEAFTTEALRYSSMIILNVQRAAAENTEINGYFIPKGTIVQVVNLYVHHDPKHWDDPYEFNPRRFLAEDGKFCAPKEGFFAFGSGRRQCLGETLAKMEYFLFSATLIQNFNIKVPEGYELDTELDDGAGLRLPKDQPLLYEYIK